MLKNNFALGFWCLDDSKLSQNKTIELVEKALELGVVTMDHADIYGEYKCEKLLAMLLRITHTYAIKCK